METTAAEKYLNVQTSEFEEESKRNLRNNVFELQCDYEWMDVFYGSWSFLSWTNWQYLPLPPYLNLKVYVYLFEKSYFFFFFK